MLNLLCNLIATRCSGTGEFISYPRQDVESASWILSGSGIRVFRPTSALDRTLTPPAESCQGQSSTLKLPKTVTNGTTSTVTYIYDAADNKLAVSQDGTVKNYYCGDFVYTSGLAVDYILTPNGQMTRNQGTGAYTAQYNITDHLGNVRSVVNSSGTVLQSTDYYPFGLAFSDANVTNNRYLYNGKELEDYTIGSSYLGTLDYGARHYDPRIGRWTVPDPMAEKYYGLSSYSYCASNPINTIDVLGLWHWGENGGLIADVDDTVQTLSEFLGVSESLAKSLLDRLNISHLDRIGEGTMINKMDLWIEEAQSGLSSVNSTVEAVQHYFWGNGKAVDVGDRANEMVFDSPEFYFVYGLLEDFDNSINGRFLIDMTNKVFHIGHSTVRFSLSVEQSLRKANFFAFSGDSFSDPRFFSEILGKKYDISRFKPDGMGPNLETKYGIPYLYAERKRTYFLPPNRK